MDTLQLSVEELQQKVQQADTPLNREFLLWLGEEADRCDGDQKQQLDRLGGQLVSIRCGFQPAPEAEVAASRDAAQQGALLVSSSATGPSAMVWQASQEAQLLERVRPPAPLFPALFTGRPSSSASCQDQAQDKVSHLASASPTWKCQSHLQPCGSVQCCLPISVSH